MKLSTCATALAITLFACAGHAADTPLRATKTEASRAKLDTGSPAPVFQPDSWLQGDPVRTFKKDKTYIVECWATWCGPCVDLIPHMNEMHAKFNGRGLVVIGVNVWDGPRKTVADFVKKKGDKMKYAVAFDGKENGRFAGAWLDAAKVTGIPHAFVVKNGKILWHGHAGDLSEGVVEDMLTGKFTPARIEAEELERQAMMNRIDALEQTVYTLLVAQKYREAMAAVDEVAQLTPKDQQYRVDIMRPRILVRMGDMPKAMKTFDDFVKENPDHDYRPYAAAKCLLDDPAFESQKQAALTYAKTHLAMDKTNEFALRLAARAEYANGHKEEALRHLKAARNIALAEKANERPAHIEKEIKAVKEGTPWPKDDY